MFRLSAAILILSIVDACLTLCHISWANGQELNPLMDWLLQNWGVVGFVSVKIAITLIGLSTIVYLSQFTNWAKQSLYFILVAYILLTIYHIILAVKFW